MLVVFAVLGVALVICGACLCKKLSSIANDKASYQSLERLKIIDE